MTEPPCSVTGDHYWRGTSVCQRCGTRLRCGCGQFFREDSYDMHTAGCSLFLRMTAEERREIEAKFA